ncbi:MAG: DNA repair protein RadA, partial [Acidimicrobiia bacterium]|nr:DNA repair protein RadA [Acidimicrobiia bacterium]
MAFSCDSCGHRSPKWMGFCPQCGSDLPLSEVAETGKKKKGSKPARSVGLDEARVDEGI